MKAEQQIINDMVTAVTPELWILFLQMLATICLTLLIYQVGRQFVAYLMMRFDKEISKNVKVRNGNYEGYITNITIQHLTLTLDNGNQVMIPIIQARSMIWEIIKNGNNKRTTK